MSEEVTYPIPPDSPPRPRPESEAGVPQETPDGALAHRAEEGRVGQPGGHARDLEAEGAGAEAVGLGRALRGQGVGEDVRGVHGVVFVGLEGDLVDEAAAGEGEEAAAGGVGLAPVGERLGGG